MPFTVKYTKAGFSTTTTKALKLTSVAKQNDQYFFVLFISVNSGVVEFKRNTENSLYTALHTRLLEWNSAFLSCFTRVWLIIKFIFSAVIQRGHITIALFSTAAHEKQNIVMLDAVSHDLCNVWKPQQQFTLLFKNFLYNEKLLIILQCWTMTKKNSRSGASPCETPT